MRLYRHTAETVGALGAGWREEKDQYCLVRFPPPHPPRGCCGELDETLPRPCRNQRRSTESQTPSPPHFHCSRLGFLSDQESDGSHLQF